MDGWVGGWTDGWIDGVLWSKPINTVYRSHGSLNASVKNGNSRFKTMVTKVTYGREAFEENWSLEGRM
jgi:hypothetical protein